MFPIFSNSPSVPQPPPEWIRVSEACQYSRLSKATLYSLLNQGLIRSYTTRKPGQIKGTRLISFASLREHLESNATGGRSVVAQSPTSAS
jgi:excisionase family DNA binding protein